MSVSLLSGVAFRGLGMEGLLQKEQKIPGAHKLAQPFRP